MPRPFYSDTDVREERSDNCGAEVNLFDGPGICMRPKGHAVNESENAFRDANSEFHQEHFEGWVWNSRGVG